MPQISIVICTFNRAALLKMAIKSLLNQNADSSLYEIIVVNNNSNDNTEEIVKDFMDNYQNIRIVLETSQGLSHSRNRGYREAKAEYVAYMDDDAKASPNWIETAIQIINQQQPDIFGGPIYPFYLSPKPEWFKDEYEIRIHAEKTGWMESGYISGSNIVFYKPLLFEFGGFNPSLGMRGNYISYGEETNLIARARENNKKIYYSLDLIIMHLVPDYKKSVAFFIYSYYKSGKDSVSILNKSYQAVDLFALPEFIDQIMNGLGYAIKNRDLNLYPFAENYILEKVVPQFSDVGNRVEYFLNNSMQFTDILNYYRGSGKIISFKELFNAIIILLKIFRPVRLLINLIKKLKNNSK